MKNLRGMSYNEIVHMKSSNSFCKVNKHRIYLKRREASRKTS